MISNARVSRRAHPLALKRDDGWPFQVSRAPSLTNARSISFLYVSDGEREEE